MFDHYAVATKVIILTLAGSVWAAGTWFVAQISGSSSSLGPLILSGIGGAGVTGAGAYVWARFVTRGLLMLIDQQQENLNLAYQRIGELENRLDL